MRLFCGTVVLLSAMAVVVGFLAMLYGMLSGDGPLFARAVIMMCVAAIVIYFANKKADEIDSEKKKETTP